MAFEGYYRYLCKTGHLHECSVYDPDLPFPQGPWDEEGKEKRWKCFLCGEPMVWWDLVDQTNGDYCPPNLPTKEECVSCQCPTCGHRHLTGHATYFVPVGYGHKVE